MLSRNFVHMFNLGKQRRLFDKVAFNFKNSLDVASDGTACLHQVVVINDEPRFTSSSSN